MKKQVLITGANRGIGLETARLFVSAGWKVIFAGRRLESLKQAAESVGTQPGEFECLEIDLASPTSISEAAGALAKQELSLDALINNAGIFPEETEAPNAQLRDAIKTNLLGPVALTRALQPRLAKAPAPCVVMVSSALGSFASCAGPDAPLREKNAPAYQISKAALNMAAVCLSRELAPSQIKVNAISPGWCRTAMGGESAPRSAADGAAAAFHAATLPPDGPTGSFLGDNGDVLPW